MTDTLDLQDNSNLLKTKVKSKKKWETLFTIEKPVKEIYSCNINDYELLGEIGSGATATVYLATVAIKIVNLEGFTDNIHEVQNEISVMIQCVHPNVVPYYSSFVEESEFWLVMKLLDGGSVLDVMKFSEHSGLEEIAIATVLKEVLKALNYFHSNGHIHRDLKAGNILIDSDGSVLLADFGVSAAFRSPNETRQTFAGTPCWMAPEVMEQTTGYNHTADLWSLGITALEMATGRAPHSHLTPIKVMLAVLNSPPPSLDLTTYPQHSRSLKKFIDCCLQKDPTKRLSADQLLKHDFIKKAKNGDYLVQTLLSKLPPLSERKAHKKITERTQTNDTTDIISEWDLSEDNTTKPILTHSQPITNPSFEILRVRLLLRNSEGNLQDIKFIFNTGIDTPEGIAKELVQVLLYYIHVIYKDGCAIVQDEQNIKNAMTSFMRDKKTIVFGLSSKDSEGAKEEEYIGYAKIQLDE